MKALTQIYWLRFAFGIVAAFICVGYGIATETIRSDEFTFNILMNGISLALITYIISYYTIIKSMFMLKVEKPRKLVTTGIGIYFLAWIVFWVLLYTIIAGPAPTV